MRGTSISLQLTSVLPRVELVHVLARLLPGLLLRSLGVSVEIRTRRVAAYPPAATGASFNAIAQRVFPTLTEPLRSRQDFRHPVGDDALWSALFETPLSELIERSFADDLTRGTVLTDALIGTFAPTDDPLLRQNRCFSITWSEGPGTSRSGAWARCRARWPARRVAPARTS